MDLTPPSEDVKKILGQAWDVLEQDAVAAVAVASVVNLAFAQLGPQDRAAPGPKAGEEKRSALKTG